MYFSNQNNFYHGIMFHHFHDESLHKKTQGSMTKEDLSKLIKFIGRKNILDADEFLVRHREKKLDSRKVCFTFDDGIRCQYDIALPVLEDKKIKSFFFVYSSLFTGKPDLLEMYRHFRINFFPDVDVFYKDFFELVTLDLNFFFNTKVKEIKQWKKRDPFYSINDIKFRLVRDKLLSKMQYEKIMEEMFYAKGFKADDHTDILFMDTDNLKKLDSLGHLVGLHSHSHPLSMESLSLKDQQKEYQTCISILASILKKKESDITYMSHPCGSYNEGTLSILKKLGIELGFKHIMSIESKKKMKSVNNSYLEIARQSHSIAVGLMN